MRLLPEARAARTPRESRYDGSPEWNRLYEAWGEATEAILKAPSRTGADILAKLTLAEEWCSTLRLHRRMPKP